MYCLFTFVVLYVCLLLYFIGFWKIQINITNNKKKKLTPFPRGNFPCCVLALLWELPLWWWYNPQYVLLKDYLLSNTLFVMAFMTLLLYLSCFFYTLALPSDYHAQLHVLCKIYLALQLYFYVMFFLSEIKFLYLASCILYLSRRLLLMESYIIKWSNLDTCSVHIAIAT